MGDTLALVAGDNLRGALVEEHILWELFQVVKHGLVAPPEEVQAGRCSEEALEQGNEGLDRDWDRLECSEALRRSMSTPTC